MTVNASAMAGNTPRHRRVWKNALHTEGSKPSLCISNPIVRLPECGCPHCSACKDTEISASLNEETSICLSATSPPSLRIPSKASKKHRHRLSDMKKSPRTAQWLPAGINHLFMSGKRDSNPRPSAWEADALPTELLPRSECKYTKSAELSSSFGQFLFSPSDIDDKRTGASVLYRKTGPHGYGLPEKAAIHNLRQTVPLRHSLRLSATAGHSPGNRMQNGGISYPRPLFGCRPVTS